VSFTEGVRVFGIDGFGELGENLLCMGVTAGSVITPKAPEASCIIIIIRTNGTVQKDKKANDALVEQNVCD